MYLIKNADSHLVAFGWDLKFYIFNKFPGDAITVGPLTQAHWLKWSKAPLNIGLHIETEKFYNFHATWRDSRERVVVYIKSAVNLLKNDFTWEFFFLLHTIEKCRLPLDIRTLEI